MTGNEDAGTRYRRAIGRTIAALRTERELSLRGMAEASGVSLAYLSEMENGLKEPSGAMLGQLAEAFGMALPEFLRVVAERIDSESNNAEISLEGLERDDIDELARFADWLRWRKGRS